MRASKARRNSSSERIILMLGHGSMKTQSDGSFHAPKSAPLIGSKTSVGICANAENVFAHESAPTSPAHSPMSFICPGKFSRRASAQPGSAGYSLASDGTPRITGSKPRSKMCAMICGQSSGEMRLRLEPTIPDRLPFGARATRFEFAFRRHAAAQWGALLIRYFLSMSRLAFHSSS